MLLNIFIKNYRSFLNEESLSMIAEPSKTKEGNIFIKRINNDNIELRLLNTAIIYGANASGKSNLLKATSELVKFIAFEKPKVGESISVYNPFKFDTNQQKLPSNFILEFIGNDCVRYKYEISFDSRNIIDEKLTYWPNNKPVVLLSRSLPRNPQSITHIGSYNVSGKRKEVEIFHNQPFLSKFGDDIPNDTISSVFLFISSIEFVDAFNTNRSVELQNDISSEVLSQPLLLEKINTVLQLVDTGLLGVKVSDNSNVFLSEYDSKSFKYTLAGMHRLFNGETLEKDFEVLPFSEESNGTKAVFSLGGKMLSTLEKGSVLFVDELETSLHPFLSKFLVSMFQNSTINKKNAQLIFTTHDTNLLDRTLFRKDQIWFAEKNEKGATSLFSLQDFNDVREDTPFDKWYLAGKFGGVPEIESLERLYSINEQANQ